MMDDWLIGWLIAWFLKWWTEMLFDGLIWRLICLLKYMLTDSEGWEIEMHEILIK